MKIRSFILLTFLLSVFILQATPQNDKRRGATEVPGIVYVEGFVYSLPRSVIIVTVDVKRELFIPGPYAAFAKKYLGYNKVEMQERTKWDISGVNVELSAEPDPGAMFKALDSVASRLTLLPDGRLAAINSAQVTAPQHLVQKSMVVNESNPRIPFIDLSSNDEYDVQVDPINGRELMIAKSLELKAQEAADYLIRLRKKRAFTILSASDVVPEDGHGYEVFVEEAKRLEKEYVELFLGKTFTSEHSFTFEFIPGDKDVRNEVLFRFSDDKGVLPKSDVSGKPIVIELARNSQSLDRANELKASQNPDAGKSGVYYRIPAMSEMKLSNGLNLLTTVRLPIAQFGVLAPVPEQVLNGNFELIFDTLTGNIKKVNKK